ncbi:MAG TPA: hypothetical protein VHX19_15350 [Stellaceae bacterium]|jgi:hypothetical protein|nr:hypothetical protein [Stellaceae bacterium]
MMLLLSASDADAGQTLALSTGNTVQIVQVGPLYSTAGWKALALKYQTTTPLSNTAELRKEADEIWNRFIIDVEKSGDDAALISASQPTTGTITTAKEYNFVFQKTDGIWRTGEGTSSADLKLTDPVVREFVDRVDWACEHNQMNACLLYLANDWTLTDHNPKANPATQVVDRNQFASAEAQELQATTNHKYQRIIDSVILDRNGALAHVVSHESDEGLTNGRQWSDNEKDEDEIEVRGNQIMFTKSSSEILNFTESIAN